MIRASRGGRLDFIELIRVVADSRHVSVSEILGPSLVITFDAGGSEQIAFDPYQGWSWRHVLVWASDAERASHARNAEAESEQWKADAMKNLSRLGAP